MYYYDTEISRNGINLRFNGVYLGSVHDYSAENNLYWTALTIYQTSRREFICIVDKKNSVIYADETEGEKKEPEQSFFKRYNSAYQIRDWLSEYADEKLISDLFCEALEMI